MDGHKNGLDRSEQSMASDHEDSVGEICSICLDQLCSSESLTTPCFHAFHIGCLFRSLANNDLCPYCRQTLPRDWLLANRLVIRLTREEYWNQVDQSFGPPNGVGPRIPSQQRIIDAALYRRFGVPRLWDGEWIEDKLLETRMRFNIPPDIILFVSDLQKIEELGRRGLTPEWSVSNWIWS